MIIQYNLKYKFKQNITLKINKQILYITTMLNQFALTQSNGIQLSQFLMPGFHMTR